MQVAHHPVGNFGLGPGARHLGFLEQPYGAPIELGIEGHPSPPHRLHLEVHGVFCMKTSGTRVIVGISLFIPPLVGMYIVEGRGILLPGDHAPIEGHGQHVPGCLGPHLLLARIVVQPAAVHAHTAAQEKAVILAR